MDQIAIGKFISEERKNKGFTQRQLADKLNISDKTISKWECGNGFPEVSLLLPLCENLEISVNELLSAKRLAENIYKKKAEENIMQLINEREINKNRFKSSIITGVISLVAFLTLVMIVIIYTAVISEIAKLILVAIACAILFAGIYVVVHEQRSIGYYKCPECNNYFVPSMKGYILAPHVVNKRLLRCPQCGKESYCKKVMSKND